MPRIDHLILIVPGMLAALRADYASSGMTPALPGVEALLRSGELVRDWSPDDLQFARLDPWQTALLRALGENCYARGLASAALSWRGEDRAARAGTCLHLQPVHLAAGVDRLHLSAVRVNADERAQLAESLTAPLGAAGFELQPGADDAWYAWSAGQLDLVTYSPHTGFDSRVYDIMPAGADGARLRRLMTEIQMLWHGHGVNVQRERRGEPPVNGAWFWGAGYQETGMMSDAPKVFASRPYARGLGESLHFRCAALPAAPDGLLSQPADKIIAVLDEAAPSVLDAHWLQPLWSALRRGAVKRIDLRMDHWRIAAHAGVWHDMKRIFRKNDGLLAELLA